MSEMQFKPPSLLDSDIDNSRLTKVPEVWKLYIHRARYIHTRKDGESKCEILLAFFHSLKSVQQLRMCENIEECWELLYWRNYMYTEIIAICRSRFDNKYC